MVDAMKVADEQRTDGVISSSPPGAPRAVRFDYVGQSWMRVPARLGDGPESRMMIDTGMGVTLLTTAACARAHCVREGTWSGKRMSGRSIELTIARIASLTVAGHRVANASVAIFDSAAMIPPELGADGIAGLDLFRDQPVTFDHRAMKIVLETVTSLDSRRASGVRAPVRVKNDGPATEVYLLLQLEPGGARLEMEVDSGSRDMILDERFLTVLGVAPGTPGVRTVSRSPGKNGYSAHLSPRATEQDGLNLLGCSVDIRGRPLRRS